MCNFYVDQNGLVRMGEGTDQDHYVLYGEDENGVKRINVFKAEYVKLCKTQKEYDDEDEFVAVNLSTVDDEMRQSSFELCDYLRKKYMH